MTRIYLIRHCEAEGNIKRIFHGHYDSDISENGRRQLEQLSERCRSLHFDAVYSSPLLRAYKTAEAANKYHGLPIQTLDGLKEINGGHWECEPFDDLPKKFADEHYAWEEEPWRFAPEGGEPMCALNDRIWSTVLDIVRENPGKNICVVSHGCAIRNFICRASGLPLERLNDIDWVDNTSVSIVDFDEELSPTVVVQSDISHLDETTHTISKQDWWLLRQQGNKKEPNDRED